MRKESRLGTQYSFCTREGTTGSPMNNRERNAWSCAHVKNGRYRPVRRRLSALHRNNSIIHQHRVQNSPSHLQIRHREPCAYELPQC